MGGKEVLNFFNFSVPGIRKLCFLRFGNFSSRDSNPMSGIRKLHFPVFKNFISPKLYFYFISRDLKSLFFGNSISQDLETIFPRVSKLYFPGFGDFFWKLYFHFISQDLKTLLPIIGKFIFRNRELYFSEFGNSIS